MGTIGVLEKEESGARARSALQWPAGALRQSLPLAFILPGKELFLPPTQGMGSFSDPRAHFGCPAPSLGPDDDNNNNIYYYN